MSKTTKSKQQTQTTDIKQLCETHKKNVNSFLSNIKQLNSTLRQTETLIKTLNSQIKTIYSDGNSLIQNEISTFLKTMENFNFSILPLIENEVYCCETFYKDMYKKLPRLSNEKMNCFYQQKYDILDLSTVLYMKMIINMTGEKVPSYKKLLYNAVQDGLYIPKTLTLLSTFKSIVDSRIGSLYFEKFLHNFNEERNVQFYRNALLFKTVTSESVKEWICREILEEFITIGSPKEITIPTQMRNKILNQYANGVNEMIFDEAKNYVFEQMQSKGYYEKFQTSQQFKELVTRITAVDEDILNTHMSHSVALNQYNQNNQIDDLQFSLPNQNNEKEKSSKSKQKEKQKQNVKSSKTDENETKKNTINSVNNNLNDNNTVNNLPGNQTNALTTNELEIQWEEELYVKVVKYLIPYNLVEYTEKFVQFGFNSPQLMSLINEKDIDKFKPTEVDRTHLVNFCADAKENKLQISQILTKESIVKVLPIQNNFLNYVQHYNCVPGITEFFNYIANTKYDQMTFNTLLSKAENAFVECNSKFHVAFRMMKKSSTVQEMQSVIPQCKTAIISLLVDEYLEEYNMSDYWITYGKEEQRISTPTLEETNSVTPDMTIDQLQKTVTMLGNESLQKQSLKGTVPLQSENDEIISTITGGQIKQNKQKQMNQNEDENTQTIKMLASCRRATEKILKDSLQNHLDFNMSHSHKLETKITQNISTIKQIILPKLIKLKLQFINCTSNNEYDMYHKQLISFVQLIEALSGDIPVVSQKEYELKSNETHLIENLKKSLNQLESIQLAAENILNQLSTMLVQFRTTNTTVVKYHNIIQKITTSL